MPCRCGKYLLQRLDIRFAEILLIVIQEIPVICRQRIGIHCAARTGRFHGPLQMLFFDFFLTLDRFQCSGCCQRIQLVICKRKHIRGLLQVAENSILAVCLALGPVCNLKISFVLIRILKITYNLFHKLCIFLCAPDRQADLFPAGCILLCF